MINQEYIKREVKRTNGNNGYVTDYVNFEEFMNKVTNRANSLASKVKSIQYIYEMNDKNLDVKGAVIIYER